MPFENRRIGMNVQAAPQSGLRVFHILDPQITVREEKIHRRGSLCIGSYGGCQNPNSFVIIARLQLRLRGRKGVLRPALLPRNTTTAKQQ